MSPGRARAKIRPPRTPLAGGETLIRRPHVHAPGALAALTAAALALGPGCRGAPPVPDRDAPPPPLDATALDGRTSPCADFYQFACGGWLARAEIPADRVAWRRGVEEVEDRTARALRGILEATAAARGEPVDPFARKLGDYWASCMDEGGVEARGLADLRAEFARIDAIQDRRTLFEEIARLALAGLELPIGLGARQDPRGRQVVLELPQGGLTLPDRALYLSDAPRDVSLRQRFAEHLRRMFALAGLPPAEVEANANAVANLEKAFAGAALSPAALRAASQAAAPLDREALAKLAPSFPWDRMLELAGLPEASAVIVPSPGLLARASQLLETAPLEAWKGYLRWRIAATMTAARALPRSFVDQAFRFESAALGGARSNPPRWRHCVRQTDEALGFALGELYVRRELGPDGEERTGRIVRELARALRIDLAGVAWMDPATRDAAVSKLDRLVVQVGGPVTVPDYSGLTVRRNDFFRNVVAARRFHTLRALATVGKPVARDAWELTPATVNAAYLPARNALIFPAAVLQPPYYYRGAPDAVNFGALGAAVGHELTHGFDEAGLRRDGEGNVLDLWSPAVAEAFEARARCLVEQYAAYEPLPGVRLDGRLTLAENAADLGGLRLAWAALQAARAAGPPAEPSRLAGFTPDQQFFVAYAQSWCGKLRDDGVARRAATDPHAPPRFRVNGPLSNMPEFARAFSCREGSPMVRPAAQRCDLW